MVLARRSVLVAVGFGLSGCANFIPKSGPARSSIVQEPTLYLKDGRRDANLGYALIDVNAVVLANLHSRDAVPMFSGLYTDVRAADVTIGIGDVLSIEIFESHSGGLFIPQDAGSRPGNFIQLQPIQVDSSGTISVPYAGTIRAAGRTPRQVAAEIQNRLENRALEPQVLVSITGQNAGGIAVLGDVGAAVQLTMNPGGIRVLGAIARAGGPRNPDYETLVTLQRHGRASTALLSEIAQNPAQNVELEPGDVVYVAHEPRYFLAVGATGQTTTLSQLDRRFTFGDYNLTLSDALARAGGLQDDRADARGVFLYRYETRETLRQLGLNVPPTLPERVPTIYMVDLSEPAGLFYCSEFWMRNRDTIFVSNAPAVELTKFISAVLPFSTTSSNFRATTR